MKSVITILLLSAAISVPALAKSAKKEKTSVGKSTEITRESLLKKSPVPERRPFPLSPRVTPCQDFHHYVCSEVENKFKLPADRDRWIFSFSDLEERLLYGKKQFFKNIKSYTPPSERAAQFKDTYLACMNKESSAAEERSFVAEEKNKISKIKTWEELAELSQSRIGTGYASFVGFQPIPNKEDPLKNDLLLMAGRKTLPERSYYENQELIVEYKKVLVDFFKNIKADRPEQRAQWVIDFETGYAQKTPLPRDMRGRMTEKRDISRADFFKKYPNLKMETFLAKIPETVTLIDLVPEGNEYVNGGLSTLPLEQLKSVYMYASLRNYLDDAYPDFYKKFFDFRHEYLGGPQKRPDRQEECTEMAAGEFGMELDTELMGILFPNFPQERVMKLAEDIRKSIITGLENNKWLSRSTKKEAIKKMQTARLFLVKPQTEDDWDYMPVQKYSSSKPYANQRLYAETEAKKSLKELTEPRKPTRWGMSPLTVNAYYSPADNKFVLPMGILQFPFFDDQLSDAENLAAIGSVIGHELGHGIDDQGAKYDFSGKVRKWFTDGDLHVFQDRGSKFIAQFNKIGHDGKLTLGENIGDHVGLTFAYNAAFPGKGAGAPEDKKKFFISYARNWCLVSTPATQQRLLKTDPHASGVERINQQVIHLDGFYEAFQCQESDKMYVAPADRIRIW
jgi:putative endopeptidase